MSDERPLPPGHRADADAPVDDRYTALRVDEELIIYDPENADAWLQSSASVELRP